MKELGYKYFRGWNIFDFLFCIFYIVYFKMEDFNRENNNEKQYLEYLPEMKVAILFLAITKLMSLIRVYDTFGILVQMIIMCLNEV